MTLIFVLENPIFTSFFLADQKIVAKSSIDKSIDVGLGEVGFGRVELSCGLFVLFQMRFENILLRVFRIELVQVSGELFVELTQLFLRDNLIQLVILGLVRGPLSSEHESHLLLDQRVFANSHHLLDKIHVVHLLGNSQSIRILLLGFVNLVSSSVRLNHLLGVSSVLGA